MARKNLIGVSNENEAEAENIKRKSRPLAGLVPKSLPARPIGGMTGAIGNIASQMEELERLKEKLASAQSILSLDPAQIDSSFISDRLGFDEAELASLVAQIGEHGQQVPILVRPHPDTTDRYQVAYGHRRLEACRRLGIPVKAVVHALSDEQLVVSQGQENNARTNLSYIERSVFAARLEDRNFTRDIIMASLGVDKAALSKMIGVVRRLPEPVIAAIGAAPEIGRGRWMDLSDGFKAEMGEGVLTLLSADNIAALPSDERFKRAYRFVHDFGKAEKPRRKPAPQGDLPVTIKPTKSGCTFAFDGKRAPGFDDFVRDRLAGLYEEFKQEKGA
ncbi:plasmid partitioning protein RepB [Martelella alba]|uniref:Plasmid partitioning protein RepB n=1 Tax=Martelella alba TaxID=2590451 RepID=A0A506TY28_9HYPH|nr:plasmid partitioning protein RepB [Martelella alba]TPW26972.1 plasmid partitioning protein RepB [Martelella alba]